MRLTSESLSAPTTAPPTTPASGCSACARFISVTQSGNTSASSSVIATMSPVQCGKPTLRDAARFLLTVLTKLIWLPPSAFDNSVGAFVAAVDNDDLGWFFCCTFNERGEALRQEVRTVVGANQNRKTI